MKEVKIGLFGFSGHQIHDSAAGLKRARVTAVAGTDEEQYAGLKQSFPETFEHAAYFSDLDDMMEKGEVDLVSFCSTPRADQVHLVIKALNAGKHVLAEKPMATTMEDLEKLREAAAASGRQIRTMTSSPYEHDFTAMRDLVAKGAVGTIVQTYSMKSYPYHDGRPQDRRVDGGIMQAGIHAISLISYVTGLEFSEVYAQDTGTGNPKDGEFQMAANVTFRMSNGSLAVILCNYCNLKSLGYHGNDQLRVHGTNGMIELVDGKTRRLLVTKDTEPRAFEDLAPAQSYPQDLVNCILDGTPTLLSQEDGFRFTEVALRAQESATTGAVLKI